MESAIQEMELVRKINTLKDNLDKLQQYKGSIFSTLQSALRELKVLRNKESENPAEYQEDIKNGLSSIEAKLKEIESLFHADPENAAESDGRYYKIHLKRVLNFGILDIEGGKNDISVMFKGKLYDIIQELVAKYLEDMKTNIPIEFRGYVSRKALEKKLYGKPIGRNRLNSHVTRIRTILLENGLTDTDFIKSLDDYIRLNVNTNDILFTEIFTGN